MMKFLAFATLIATTLTISATSNLNKSAANEPSLVIEQPTSLTLAIDPDSLGILGYTDPEDAFKVDDLTKFASTLLGRKYVWGAVGPKNFDCSGFTSYVFRQHGIDLPRTSRMQYNIGDKVEIPDLQPGDLVFFSSPRTKKGVVGHVGIVHSVDKENNSMTFIHASTKKGIAYQKFPDNGYYSRNYIGAKRVI
ncbi:MAG: NlpC/P60 family protein [Bacteroides sp.]|nr:NlpC/P60 family protein [Bacteroides sp.]MCM1413671.1 NlpC/P60 family protein [Bacteroides sp.]MCM1471850.1 NlpC/P60 family protein [Bacteroides sp.]